MLPRKIQVEAWPIWVYKARKFPALRQKKVIGAEADGEGGPQFA